MHTSHQAELARYDAVLFFETALVAGIEIEGGNRYRTESKRQAIDVDRRLRALWSEHPRFHFVPHNPSFLGKITLGLSILERLVGDRPTADAT
jgi:hypothetical protein